MYKIGQIISDIEDLTKAAFIPAPQGQGGPQQGGQGQGQDPQMQQLLQQLPPEIAQQIQQLPPAQQQAALSQLMQQAGGQGQGQGQPQGQPDPQGTTQTGDPNQMRPSKVQGESEPTDLDNSTISIRIRDLLDLVSGGNATKATLQVAQHHSNAKMKQDQLMQKQKLDAEKAKQKQLADQQAATMANQGGMMGAGGIYGQDPNQQGQPQQ